jgi:hypothetical protein
MIKTYNYDYIIENFAKSFGKAGKAGKAGTDVASEVGTSKTVSKATKLLQQGKDYTSRKAKQAQDFANRKWNETKKNAPIQYRKTKEYVHDHKGKIVVTAIAAGTVGAATGLLVDTHVKADKAGVTFEEQLERENNQLNDKIEQDKNDAADAALDGTKTLAGDVAGFTGDVFEAVCPNCKLYFIIGGVVFVGLILLFYFKK